MWRQYVHDNATTVLHMLLVGCDAVDRTADASRELQIFRHDGDPLGVDGTEVAVFEEVHEEVLRRFLQRHHTLRRPPEAVSRVVIANFLHEPRERQPPQQQLRRLLVLSDFTQSHCPRLVPPLPNCCSHTYTSTITSTIHISTRHTRTHTYMLHSLTRRNTNKLLLLLFIPPPDATGLEGTFGAAPPFAGARYVIFTHTHTHTHIHTRTRKSALSHQALHQLSFSVYAPPLSSFIIIIS